jgi:hypothetical protein
VNFATNNVIATAYHSTEVAERWSFNPLSVFLLSLSGFIMLFVGVFWLIATVDELPAKMVKVFRLKQAYKKFRFDVMTDQYSGGFSNAEITGGALVILVLLAGVCGASAIITRDDHLVQNIHQKYAIDDLKQKKPDGPYTVESRIPATVTRGDATYEVIITQNSETYEPTLLSAETNIELQ